MPPVPTADPALRAFFLAWLDRFAGFVREVDYHSARPLFHPEVLAFGTYRAIIPGLDAWVATQWDNVWPRTTDFRFDTEGAQVIVAADASMAAVLASWTSTGYAPDGVAFDRPGRATMVFHRLDGEWLCTHSHMSLNKGVPQDSHADRPVKPPPPARSGGAPGR